MLKLKKNGKWDVFKILLWVVTLSFAGFCLFEAYQTRILNLDTEGLAQIEYMSSGVQRVSKLELEGSSDEALVVLLDATAEELYSEDGSSKYFAKSAEIALVAKGVVEDWSDFKLAVLDFRESGNRDKLFSISESNYNKSIEATKKISAYISGFDVFVGKLEMCLIGHIILMGLLLIKILADTASELQKNKELSKDMFIDLSTGLYNRSKCQEVLKNPATPNNSKERAVVIFDLNDLKKTNDTLGHRAGDQLISTFAEQLKKATKIFPYETFVGRYGGDEFMAYFDSVVEKDVKLYIKEVDFLMKKFNETSGKPFKLSCAAGYSITTKETKSLTMRELFDAADSDMYKNKLAMKEKIRQEMREQGIEEIAHEDDRL